MPWKESKALDERKRFTAEWEKEEKILASCAAAMAYRGRPGTPGYNGIKPRGKPGCKSAAGRRTIVPMG
jgi:hypothetical protein